MSKKLVKTAKEQFEERLRELNVVREWKMCDTEIYYLCEDSNAHVYLLRDQDGEYKQLDYGQQYEALVFSSRFLCAMSERFVELDIDIKPFFDWYASADHDNEPFSLLDIFMCELEESHFTFEDLYEEVPDVRIITAKEQWEKDTDGLIVARNNEDKVLFVNIMPSEVKFYDNYNGYASYIYPSMEEMRKDASFVSRVVDELMRSANHDKIGVFMEWVREGGSFPLNPAVIYDSEFQGFTFMTYEDKEEPVEQVDNNVDMSPVESIREEIISKIRTLYDMGYVVDTEKLKLDDFIGYVDGTGNCLDGYDLGIYEGVNGKLGLDFNSTGEWQDLKKSQRMKYGDAVGGIHQVCIEHLHAILKAMVLPE